ncbi:MAG: prepilin-type N-terminal cleavage/methylation domain-containing protein [Gemmatimonadales bacterium]
MCRSERSRDTQGRRRWPSGFTLIETIVALFLFAVGGLALAGTSAAVGRALNTNAVRERAARIAATRVEILAAECNRAASGRESIGHIESAWSISSPDSSRLRVFESIRYATWNGVQTDSYRAVLPCRQ